MKYLKNTLILIQKLIIVTHELNPLYFFLSEITKKNSY